MLRFIIIIIDGPFNDVRRHDWLKGQSVKHELEVTWQEPAVAYFVAQSLLFFCPEWVKNTTKTSVTVVGIGDMTGSWTATLQNMQQ